MVPYPGPARRLLRNRTRLVAVAMLAVTVIAASVLQSTAATVLQQTSTNWRGAYDILVTPANRDSNGYLRSDALTDATTGRLSFSDLERIRALPGVDVAAPIAEVAFADSSLTGEAGAGCPCPCDRIQAWRVRRRSRMATTSTSTIELAGRSWRWTLCSRSPTSDFYADRVQCHWRPAARRERTDPSTRPPSERQPAAAHCGRQPALRRRCMGSRDGHDRARTRRSSASGCAVPRSSTPSRSASCSARPGRSSIH